MTRWDSSPEVFLGMMALAVICLWVSLRFVLRNHTRRRRRIWQRLVMVTAPVAVSLMILIDYLCYVVMTYHFILHHPNLW